MDKTQQGLNILDSIRSSLGIPKVETQTRLPGPAPTSAFIETTVTPRPVPQANLKPLTPQTKVGIPGRELFDVSPVGKPLYTPLKEQIRQVTAPKQLYTPTQARITPLNLEQPLIKFPLVKIAKPLGQGTDKILSAINFAQKAKGKSTWERALEGVSGAGEILSIPNEVLIQPTWSLTKIGIKAIVQGNVTKDDVKKAYYAVGSERNTLGDALGLDEKTTNPVVFQAVRLIDFLPELIDIPTTSAIKGGAKFVKYAKEVPTESKAFDDALEQGAKAFEDATGEAVTPEAKEIIKNIRKNPKELANIAKSQQPANLQDFGGNIPPTIDSFNTIRNLERDSSRIPVPPTTAELRPARYGVAEQEFRDFATTNIDAIADNILPSVNLNNIDNLAGDLAYITSKEAQDIVKKLSNADPKLSQDIAIEAQRQSGRVVDALRASGGQYTPEVMDALTRDNSFRRIIGQQLNGLKNEVDGLFDKVNSRNIDDIQQTIGRKLTPDEISDIKSATTPDEINKVADDLRATSQKLTKGQERMRFLENQLKDLDNYEEQWKKAQEFMVKNNIDPNNKEEFEKVLREFMPANWYDWVQKLRFNSMLSAPTTLINSLNYFTTLFYNTAKYTVRGILEQTTKAGAKLIGKEYKPQYDALSGIRYAGNYLNQTSKILKGPAKQWVYDVLGIMKNTDSLNSTSDQIELLRGNVINKNIGILKRIKEANKNFGRAFENIAEKFGIDAGFYRLGKEGSFAGAVEDVLDIPSNMLGAIDNMMAYITYGAERGAFTKGAKGINQKAVKNALRDLLRQDLNEKGAGILSDGVGALFDYVGSMKTYKMGSKDFGSRFVRYIGDQMFPFLTVAGNFLKTGLEASPLGVANLLKSTDKMEVLSKMILSLGISSYAVNKYASGEITGAFPSDKATQDYWKENGIKPFSIKVGDTWVEYAKFKPEVSVPLMVLTGIQDAQKQKDITQSDAQRYLAMASSIYQFFSQQSFVQNLGLLNDLENPDLSDSAIGKLTANTVQQFIPFAGSLRWLGRLQSGEMKDPQTFTDFLIRDMPYLKDYVPAKLDEQGNKIIDEYRVYNSVPLLGKFSAQREGAMEGLKELRNEQFINKSKKKIQDVIDEDVKRYKAGEIQNVQSGEGVKFIEGLNNIDPINIYWFNPVEDKIETYDISFIRYNPQNETQLKNYESKYNKLINDIQYNPYISEKDLNNALNRLDVPENKRINLPIEEKFRFYQLDVPEEKKPKIKATPEEMMKNIQFAQLRGQIKEQSPFFRAQGQAARALRGPRMRKPRLPKPKKPKVKQKKLPRIKIKSQKKVQNLTGRKKEI